MNVLHPPTRLRSLTTRRTRHESPSSGCLEIKANPRPSVLAHWTTKVSLITREARWFAAPRESRNRPPIATSVGHREGYGQLRGHPTYEAFLLNLPSLPKSF